MRKMTDMKHILNIWLPALCLAFAVMACADDGMDTPAGENGSLAGQPVRIGTRSGSGTVVDAADLYPWLQPSLENGWDIKYWIKGTADPSAEGGVALLQLQTENNAMKRDASGMPYYTLTYKSGPDAGKPAKWYGNGPHIFQGVYPSVHLTTDHPSEIPADLTTDQHDDSETVGSEGNYTMLRHYLAMRKNCEVNASVARIQLPYCHRLSRVLLYVLISPELRADGVTIKGYQLVDASGQEDLVSGKDNALTSSIRFDNVDVLKQIDYSEDAATLQRLYTPVWEYDARSVIPHSLGEFGSMNSQGHEISGLGEHCIVYYDQEKEAYYTPSADIQWNKARTAYENAEQAGTTDNCGYVMIDYGKVPCYDLIIRPTYTHADSVMYDEDLGLLAAPAFANAKNTFDVLVTLSNGLTEKASFSVDLNANYQLALYMMIDPERVNCDTSYPILWDEQTSNDDWYGVNNALGHSLSIAGSSWQRAYRIGSPSLDGNGADKITDGNFYGQETSSDDTGEGQYLTEAEWIAKFLEATATGANHGDYFILDQDVSVTVPAGFVFTGHLDAQDHTVTFSQPLAGLDGTYTAAQESASLPVSQWEANVHHEGTVWVPTAGYRAEILNAVIGLTGSDCNFLPMTSATAYDASVTGYVFNCRKAGTVPAERFPDNKPSIPEY